MIITDVQNRQIGVELTEWLDKRQTTPSIGEQKNQMKWLDSLDTEHHTSTGEIVIRVNTSDSKV